MGIAICNNSDCKYIKNCSRYKDVKNEMQEYNFKAICREETNYEFLIQNEVAIEVIKTEDKEDTNK